LRGRRISILRALYATRRRHHRAAADR
jgi:hypothetical protein